MNVFPTFPGLTWDITKTPQWATGVQRATSGKELRGNYMSYPVYKFSLTFEVLREAATYQEVQALTGFILNQLGKANAFLYTDSTDHTVTAQNFGTGNGSNVYFQLSRTQGEANEPIMNLNGSPVIYRTDWQGKQQLYPTPRTNIIKNSAEFNSVWSLFEATVSANAANAPDGNLTADKLIASANNNYHTTSQTSVAGANGAATWAVSVYAKADEYTSFTLAGYGEPANTAGFSCRFNLATLAQTPSAFGGASITGNSITSLGNGWYRCAIVGSPNSADTQMQLRIALDNPPGTQIFTGNGVAGMLFWGAQVEAGNTATSYIPTGNVPSVTITDYNISATGLVTVSPAPLANAVMSWDGSYYYRCRFDADEFDINNFMYQLWEAKSVEFMGSLGVKP